MRRHREKEYFPAPSWVTAAAEAAELGMLVKHVCSFSFFFFFFGLKMLLGRYKRHSETCTVISVQFTECFLNWTHSCKQHADGKTEPSVPHLTPKPSTTHSLPLQGWLNWPPTPYSSFTPPPFFFVFRATPATYEGSQARGLIEATATRLHHSHSNARSKQRLWPTPQQCWILNPLSEVRDRTRNFMVPSLIHFPCTTMGTRFAHFWTLCKFKL